MSFRRVVRRPVFSLEDAARRSFMGHTLLFKRIDPADVAQHEADGWERVGATEYADDQRSVLVVMQEQVEDPSRMGDAICLALLAFGVGCLVVVVCWLWGAW